LTRRPFVVGITFPLDDIFVVIVAVNIHGHSEVRIVLRGQGSWEFHGEIVALDLLDRLCESFIGLVQEFDVAHGSPKHIDTVAFRGRLLEVLGRE